MKSLINTGRHFAVAAGLGTASLSCSPQASAGTPEIVVWPHQASNVLHVARETAQPFYIMAYSRGSELKGATDVEVSIPENWQVWRGSEAPPSAKAPAEAGRIFKSPLSLRATKDQADSKDYSSGNAAGNLLLVARPLSGAGESSMSIRWLQKGALLAERQVSLKPVDLGPRAAVTTGAGPMRKLTVGMWLNDPQFNAETMAEVYRGLRRAGVDYVIITKAMYAQSKDVLREQGIQVFINQWWHFTGYVPTAPPAEAQSTLKDGTVDIKRWSPTYMAEGGTAFIKAVEAVADELKTMDGIHGFMLDYEPGLTGLDADYGAQSRLAFEKYLNEKVAAWPADVLPKGKHEEAWINFRNDQSEAYVRWFQKILKQRTPGVFLSVSTSGATGTPDDPNRRLAATDITQFSRAADSIHPQLYSWTSRLPAQLPRFNDKLKLGYTTLAGAKARVYPTVGTMVGKGALSNPEYLQTQVLAWWFHGASGFEIWQYFYGVDGRYLALTSEMAKLFGEAGDRPAGAAPKDSVLTTQPTGDLEILSRNSADGKTAWAGLFNFSPKTVRVPLKARDGWRLAEAEPASITLAPWRAHVVKCLVTTP